MGSQRLGVVRSSAGLAACLVLACSSGTASVSLGTGGAPGSGGGAGGPARIELCVFHAIRSAH